MCDVKVSGTSEMAAINGSRSDITYISAFIYDSQTIPKAVVLVKEQRIKNDSGAFFFLSSFFVVVVNTTSRSTTLHGTIIIIIFARE